MAASGQVQYKVDHSNAAVPRHAIVLKQQMDANGEHGVWHRFM